MDALPQGRLIGPHSHSAENPLAGFIRFPRTQVGQLAQPTVSDHADLSQAAASPAQVLNEELLRALGTALSTDDLPLNRAAAVTGFSPEKVAEGVLGYIDAIIGTYSARDPERTEKLEQASAAIEKGFNDAREVLDSLGVLRGEVADTIDRIQALIEEGLARLFANGAPVNESPVAAGADVSKTIIQSASFASRQATSLVIDTVDGDRVTVEIERQASISGTHFAVTDGETRMSGAESSSEVSVGFSYRVQGELDEEERRAIDALISRVDKVSDRFFAGNMQAAFNKAARLEFDSEELAGFSLEMNQSRSHEAVTAYRETSAIEQPEGNLADVAAFGGELRNLFGEAAQHRFSDPEKAIGSLFNHLVGERANGQIHKLTKEAFSMLRDLVDVITHQQEQLHGSEKVEQSSDED